MSKPQIEIFFADICGLCHKAMDFFRSRDLEFTTREVHWDEEADRFDDSENAREMYERCGEVDFVPQIFINGEYIGGSEYLEQYISESKAA